MSDTRMGLAAASALALTGLLGAGPAAGQHDHHDAEVSGIVLSAEVAALLGEEMRSIEKGLGSLMIAMASGDWPHVAETGEQIEKSYILAQRLTPEQREELGRALPQRFKTLDATFHRAAGKLAGAARAGDGELAVFYAYKLMEVCVACHESYASDRFPGFSATADAHEHR